MTRFGILSGVGNSLTSRSLSIRWRFTRGRRVHRRKRQRFTMLIAFIIAFSTLRARSYSRNPTQRLVYPRLKQCTRGIVDEVALHRALVTLHPGADGYDGKIQMRKQMSQKSYFFALNLRNSEEVILYLLAAIMKACIFFATISTEDRECCYVSVYESGSTDATRRLLKLVQNDLTKLRIRHTIVTNGIRRDTREHRIKFLAAVRNEALRPYYANSSSWDEVIFLNDVVVCTSNIIELVDKKLLNSADVASGMEYIVRKNTVLFYDIWVNKDITGRSFQNKQPTLKIQNRGKDIQRTNHFKYLQRGLAVLSLVVPCSPILAFVSDTLVY